MIPTKEEIESILDMKRSEMISCCGNLIRQTIKSGNTSGFLTFDSECNRDFIANIMRSMSGTYGIRLGIDATKDAVWILEWWIKSSNRSEIDDRMAPWAQ